MANSLVERDMTLFTKNRGCQIKDTAVSQCQIDFLCEAVDATEDIEGNLFEIGSYRGVTTSKLAERTKKTIFAVDPFIGYGGAESDLEIFSHNTVDHRNVKHIRKTSGRAITDFCGEKASLVFVDAVHDVSNSWFDIVGWSRLISKGGMLAMHDVDDHSGSNLSARRFINRFSDFKPWGYCPNLLILRRY